VKPPVGETWVPPPAGRSRIDEVQRWQLQQATSEGIPVDGCFLWSAQDNLEWIYGFGDRFGIVYVHLDTLERTPKLSAEWFREPARQNEVV
jgi:beta-glucosidase